MEDRYEPEVCLIQIATDESVFIVDPFDGIDLEPIWALVADPDILTVVHAGQEDLGLCVQHLGRPPRSIFDVQIAAGFVGLDYPLSLQKLVQGILHIRLHKSKTLTDWRKRPLSDSQLRYAAEDVLYLPAVHRILTEQLIKRNRLAWAQEECRKFEEITLYRRVEEEKLRRMKGAGSLGALQLAVLHAMMAWRDELAKVVNRPARTVVKDHLLVEIARAGLTGFKELRDLRGLNLSDKHLKVLCDVVTRARQSPEHEWPTPSPRETESPAESALVELGGALIRDYCLANELAYSLVATKRSIRALVRRLSDFKGSTENDAELLQGWRGRTVGTLLTKVLSGKTAITVKRLGNRLAIRTRDV